MVFTMYSAFTSFLCVVYIIPKIAMSIFIQVDVSREGRGLSVGLFEGSNICA